MLQPIDAVPIQRAQASMFCQPLFTCTSNQDRPAEKKTVDVEGCVASYRPGTINSWCAYYGDHEAV
eukprot:4426711-Prorocentrum_lima.AAC.1